MAAHQPDVLVLDDRLAARRGMELLLAELGFGVRVAPDDVDQARAELLEGRYDVALVEIRRRAGDGIEMARAALAADPGARLVLCTGYAEPRRALIAAAGVRAPGLVLTVSPAPALADALRTVAGGGRFLDPAIQALVSEEHELETAVDRLSPREREVLGLLADGYQGPEIAERLFLSLETVRTHIRNAATKLGARTRVQAAAMVARSSER